MTQTPFKNNKNKKEDPVLKGMRKADQGLFDAQVKVIDVVKGSLKRLDK